jgi:hypothetical protein
MDFKSQDTHSKITFATAQATILRIPAPNQVSEISMVHVPIVESHKPFPDVTTVQYPSSRIFRICALEAKPPRAQP